MTDAHAHSPTDHDHAHGDASHSHSGPHFPVKHYRKIYFWLLGLFAVSAVGPEVSQRVFGEGTTVAFVFTMFTAFGIAIVKATLVALNFMHLNVEKKLASMIVVIALVLLGLFFFGAAPDIMAHHGDNWVNVAAKAETKRRIEREGEHGEKMGGHGSGGSHGAAHGDAHAAPGAAATEGHGAAPAHKAPAR